MQALLSNGNGMAPPTVDFNDQKIHPKCMFPFKRQSCQHIKTRAKKICMDKHFVAFVNEKIHSDENIFFSLLKF
jgi:hypothetical protein